MSKCEKINQQLTGYVRLVTWHVPDGEVPDGVMLVEVDLAGGDSDVALVYIDDEDCETLKDPEHGDVWTAWQWSDVSRYALLDDILPDRQDGQVGIESDSQPTALPADDAICVNTVDEILKELDRAVTKFPTWPTDPLHALAILGEEFGELNKAMLQLTYEPHKEGTSVSRVREESIQTAAMALRLAMSLDRKDCCGNEPALY